MICLHSPIRIYRALMGAALLGMLFPVVAMAEVEGELPRESELRAPEQSTNAVPREVDSGPSWEEVDVFEQNIYEDVVMLTEAMLMVRRYYVDELDYRKIIYSALHGMLSNLDPHSDFLEPEQTDEMKEDTESRFVGIGIEVGIRGGHPLVITPIEESPAQAAGLMSGDIITAIEGKPTYNHNLGQIVKKLRGKVGSEVTVTIKRDADDPFDVTLTRKMIKVKVVKGVKVLPGRVGYLRLTQFSEPTTEEVAGALKELQTNDLAGIVLDLRDNPGGLLEQAVGVASFFLSPKHVVVTTKGRREGFSDKVFHTDDELPRSELPLVVLINRGSASAAEIVAGALQDHGRAVVIGERSFGKASVQRVMQLNSSKGMSIKLTTAHYYTPSERLIHEKGIQPDIEVVLPPSMWYKLRIARSYEERPEAYPESEREDFGDITDQQLQRACDVLMGIDIYNRQRQHDDTRH